MISQTAEYALRAVAHLAVCGEQGSTTQHIADATLVPRGYLAKVLKELARSGIVRSQRGPTGGFTLVADPEELRVLDVVEAVGPLPRIRSCPLGIEEHVTLCPLHRLLDDAVAEVEAALADVVVSQLVTSTRHPQVLCRPGRKLAQLRVEENGPPPARGRRRRE
jgi:Rrf2 family protein